MNEPGRNVIVVNTFYNKHSGDHVKLRIMCTSALRRFEIGVLHAEPASVVISYNATSSGGHESDHVVIACLGLRGRMAVLRVSGRRAVKRAAGGPSHERAEP